MTDTADTNDGHVASKDPTSGRTHPFSRRNLSRSEIEVLRDLAEEFGYWPATTDDEHIAQLREQNARYERVAASQREGSKWRKMFQK